MGRTAKQAIEIEAQVKTTLVDMKKTVAKMRDGLSEGAAKIDISKGLGASLSKQLSNFKDEYDKFSRLTSGNLLNLNDSKEALKSGEQMIKIFKEIQRVSGNFKGLTVFDAKKMFPQAFQNEVAELQKKLNGISSTLANLEIKQLDLDQAEKDLSNLNTKVEGFKKELAEKTTLEASLKIKDEEAQKQLNETREALKAIRDELKSSFKIKVDAAEVKKNTATSKLNMETEKINKARADRGFAQEDFSKDARGTILYKGKNLTQYKQSGATKEEKEAVQQIITLYSQEEKLLKDLRKEQERLEKSWKELNKEYGKFDSKTLNEIANDLNIATDLKDGISDTIQAEADAFKKANEAAKELQETQKEASTIKEKMQKASDAVQEQETKVKRLTVQYNDLKSKVDEADLTEAFKKLDIDFSPEMLKDIKSVEGLQGKLRKLDESDLKTLKKNLTEIGFSAKEAEDFIDQLRDGLNKVGGEAKELEQVNKEMDNLRQQVLDFFSLTNSIQIVKRAVSSAFTSVKELDAVMTEAAVVTDFSISDMWEKLPEYASNASKLGVATKDLYGATTLYYQQGLKNNEAMALGVETMKMARIAGMQASEATTAMTAALRGFNMELNETNAQRVNDVYSELAAITAADANQIATAMGKTASIAASANMEFETTAAFLAQIIETTQEAPETAGTALKTIIARFSEVKNLRNQGLTSGQDEEGEAIDVNKIQTALRQVGISMEGFFAGTEGLDPILTKLAEKWDDLDFETQRYIATMAAGSRQQSRFIAMMSDYGRTTELVSAANNSAGASQKQFNKTLESLDAKLAQLKNQWQQFTMNIMNNELIKWGVDALTNILTVVNKLISALPEATRGFASLAAIWGTMQVGKKAIGGVSDKLSGGLFGKIFGKGVKIDAKEAEQDLRQGGQAAEVSMKQGGNAAESSMIQGGQTAKAELTAGAKQAAQILVSAAKQSAATEQAEEIGNTVPIDQPSTQLPATSQPSTKPSFYEKLGKGSAVKGKVTAGIAAFGIMNMVSGVTGLVESYKKAKTLDDELEKVGSTLAEVRTLASEAASEMDTLADAKVNFKDMSKSLNEMAKGTMEWKKQLVKTNNAVLDLLDEYPQLAAHVERGESGELMVSDAGWDMLEESALKKSQAAQNTQLGLMMQKGTLQQEEAFLNSISSSDQKSIAGAKMFQSDEGTGAVMKTFSGGGMAIGSLIGGPVGGLIGAGVGALAGGLVNLIGGSYSPEDAERDATGGLTQEEFSKLAAEAVEQGVSVSGGSSRKDFEKVYQSLGYDTSDFDSVFNKIQEMGSEFDKLANQSYSLSLAQEQYAHQLIENIAEASSVVSNSKYMDQAVAVEKQKSDEYIKLLEDTTNKILNDRDYVTKEGEATEKLITEYAGYSGQTKDEVKGQIEAKTLSVETMTSAVASGRVEGEKVEKLEKTTKTLERYASKTNVSQSQKDFIMNSLTEDGKELNRSQVGMVSQILSAEGGEQKGLALKLLKDQGLITGTQGEIDLERMGLNLDDIIDNWRKGSESYKTGDIAAKQLGLQDTDLGALNQQRAGTFNSILQKMRDSASVYGSAQNHQNVLNIMNELVGENGPIKDVDAFYDQIKDLDWTNKESIEGLSSALVELGIVSLDQSESINTLETEIIRLGNAATNVSLADAINEFFEASTIIEEVRSGRQGRIFSKDQMIEIYGENFEKLDEFNRNFIKTAAGYAYKGANLRILAAEWEQKNTNEVTETILGVEKGYIEADQRREKLESNNLNFEAIDYESAIGSGQMTTLKALFENTSYESLEGQQKEIFSQLFNTTHEKKDWNALVSQFGSGYNIATGSVEATSGSLLTLLTELGIIGPDDSKTTENESLAQAYSFLQAVIAGENYKTHTGHEATVSGKYGYLTRWVNKNQGTQSYAQKVRTRIGGDYVYLSKPEESNITLSFKELAEGLKAGTISSEDKERVGVLGIENDELLSVFKSLGFSEADVKEAESKEGQDQFKFMSEKIVKFLEDSEYEVSSQQAVTLKTDYEKFFTSALTAQEVASYGMHENNEYAKGSKETALQTRVLIRDGMALAESFSELLGEGEGLSNLTLALTSDFIDNNEALGNLITGLQELQGVLTKSNRETTEYAQALEKAGQALSLTFGLEKGLSSEFLRKNADLLESFVAGDDKAWNSLSKEIAIQIGGGINTSQLFSVIRDMAQGTPKSGTVADFGGKITISQDGQAYITQDQMIAMQQQAMLQGATLTFGGTTKWLDQGKISDSFIEGAQQIQVFDDAQGAIIAAKTEMASFLETLRASFGETQFDKFFNIQERINKLLRMREIYEKRYERLLQSENSTLQDILKNKSNRLMTLAKEREEQEAMAELSKKLLNDYLTTNSKYISPEYIQYDEETQTFSINEENLSMLSQKDQAEALKVLETATGLRDRMWESIDRLEDIDWEEEEVKDQGKDEYLDFEERVKEALLDDRQREIDKLSEINDSINDANAKMIEAIQKSISDYRQARDSERTEEDIADKQARLAYLQQNTSGANAVEILALQKEIDQAQENYTDTLIDQKISALQDQNDQAAEQRERQISILEAQKEQYENSGKIWTDVKNLIDNGIGDDGMVLDGSSLLAILQKSEGFNALSEIGKAEWSANLVSQVLAGLGYLGKVSEGYTVEQAMQEGLHWAGKDITFTYFGKEIEGEIQKDGSVIDEKGRRHTGVHYANGKYVAPDKYTFSDGPLKGQTYLSQAEAKAAIDTWVDEQIKAKKKAIGGEGNYSEAYYNYKFGAGWKEDIKAKGENYKNKIVQYKTGGLADYTGPAWLDGTKTRPELVLNARDTQNFIQLKDILASLLNSQTPKASENSGAVNYDIDINVETINNETDLDMIANYIENKIVTSANYRNNTLAKRSR